MKNTARIDKVNRLVPVTALQYILRERDLTKDTPYNKKANGLIKNPQPKRDREIMLKISFVSMWVFDYYFVDKLIHRIVGVPGIEPGTIRV